MTIGKYDDRFVAELARKLNSNVCVLCTKEFETKAQLEIHFWDHTNDRYELECLICGASYIDKNALSEHVQEHIREVRAVGQVPSPTSPVFKLSKMILSYFLSLILSFLHSYFLSFFLFKISRYKLFFLLISEVIKKQNLAPEEPSPQPSTSGLAQSGTIMNLIL